MIVSIIVAADENNAIGINNQLPWHLPVDLKYFKQLTLGHTIIMGRKTYESIGKPLPGRTSVVITSNKEIVWDGIEKTNSLAAAIEFSKQKNETECFIIGGGMIFKDAIALADKIYLTRIHTSLPEADTFFPALKKANWKLTTANFVAADEKNKMDCTFEVYEKTI